MRTLKVSGQIRGGVITKLRGAMRQVQVCESCAVQAPHTTRAATAHSSQPEYGGYELCAECAEHLDADGEEVIAQR